MSNAVSVYIVFPQSKAFQLDEFNIWSLPFLYVTLKSWEWDEAM